MEFWFFNWVDMFSGLVLMVDFVKVDIFLVEFINNVFEKLWLFFVVYFFLMVFYIVVVIVLLDWFKFVYGFCESVNVWGIWNVFDVVCKVGVDVLILIFFGGVSICFIEFWILFVELFLLFKNKFFEIKNYF